MVPPPCSTGSIPAWAGKPDAAGSRSPVSRVYPRVGGETIQARSQMRAGGGLSPRGRGNRLSPTRTSCIEWSIPAWAGKPERRHRDERAAGVYPRVGGETKVEAKTLIQDAGLSPRGRGNPRRPPGLRSRSGSIPAWAGKPRKAPTKRRREAVYPRVGGETIMANSYTWVIDGLSPRGRGNRWSPWHRPRQTRSIPAWAGKPSATATRRLSIAVYPRVGGETDTWGAGDGGTTGLSPRGRGNRLPTG